MCSLWVFCSCTDSRIPDNLLRVAQIHKQCGRLPFCADMKRVKDINLLLQQRVVILFCVRIGWSQRETRIRLKQAYGHLAMSKMRIHVWHKSFSNGRTQVTDLPRAARRKTGRSEENVQTIKNVLAEDRRFTIAAMTELTGINPSAIQRILKIDLGLMRRAACLVPHFLTGPQEYNRMDTCLQMLRRTHQDPLFLSSVITMDESWVYQYDPLQRQHASEWLARGDPRPVHCNKERTTGKVLLVSFFDQRGLIYREFLRNTNVNQAVFISILQRLRRQIRIKRPKIFKNWWLHMDNAPAHMGGNTVNYLLLTGTQVLKHPPYSPDLAPSDFWFYPRLKKPLRGVRFGSLDELERAVDVVVAAIPSHEYKHCITVTWPKRWARCVDAQGAYFEGLTCCSGESQDRRAN